MFIQEHVPIGRKTTMRIGGEALYYAEISTKEDVEEAWTFAKEKNVPLILLGGGANTIFADGTVHALVIRLKNETTAIDGNQVMVGAGKILASLINELADNNLDLSALTGIPGMVGGSIFGNAGQGPGGIWFDSFIEHVTAFIDGKWKTLSKEDCHFRYRESIFKDMADKNNREAAGLAGPAAQAKPLREGWVHGRDTVGGPSMPIIWEATLILPSKPKEEVKAEVVRLIKKRIETQPHVKTAGSCFKALPDGTPAWTLIDAAGLRGTKIGGVEISTKHANFLLNVDKATFNDALMVTKLIREKVPQIAGIEMRFYGEDGKIAA